MLKCKTNQGLLERIVSGFKKKIIIGAFALAGLLPYGCVSKEAELHRNITRSILEQGKKKIREYTSFRGFSS